MAKAKVYLDSKNVEKVIGGVIKNADIVAKTYGYSGHGICIRYNGRNMISNDGVFVSSNIFLTDELEDIGSGFVRDITFNSDLSSNDGTTASAILTKSIVLGLKPYLLRKKKNNNMLDVKRGMYNAVDDIITCLKMQKRNLDITDEKMLYQVAFTATRSKTLSDLLSEAFLKIGSTGRVLYQEQEGNNIEVEYKHGFNLEYGYVTNMLPNVLLSPFVLLYEERINSTDIMLSILKTALSFNCKDLVLFVKDGVADIVMQQLIQIQQNKDINININVIKMTGNLEKIKREMFDLSLTTSSRIFDNSTINSIDADSFGTAKSINISDKQTTIIGGNKKESEIAEHLGELEKTLKNNRNEMEKEQIKKRIANIKGQVAIIKIGALSREQIDNYKEKIKDAVGSIKNAIDDGIVPGGGVALLNAYKLIVKDKNSKFQKSYNKDEEIGYNIVLNSLKAPIKQILQNSYVNCKQKEKEIFDNSNLYVGYNAMTRKLSTNLTGDGVIDPYVTIINSLKNSVELCSMFTNLDGFIIIESEVLRHE